MNNILELIRNEEVKWVSLGRFFKNIVTGKLNANKREENGIYPFYTCDEKPYRINTYAFDCEALLVSGNGSKVGHINYYKGKFNAYQRTYVLYDLKENNDIKYIYYYLKFALKKYLNNNIFKGSIPFITMPILTEFKIPIPSLELQEKIVEILDTFTLYQEKNRKRIRTKKKQYEYYKDMLLSQEYLLKKAKELCGQDAVVQWEKLGEVCDVRDGTHDSPKRQNNGKYLITSKNVKNGGINFENAYYISEIDYEKINKRSKVDVNDLLFTMIGTIGEIAYITEEPDYAIKNVGLIKTKNLVNQRFIFYCLQSEYTKEYIEKNKSKGTQAFMALGALRNMPFPIPPLQVQEWIVNTLYPFYTICYDLDKGLPKEVKLRTKQYEYYREKLLNFKK